MAEVRVQLEGSFRVVQGSGSGATWATASAPPSGLLAYVQSFNFTSAQTVTTITERGIPSHHKITQKAPINLTVNALWTGGMPTALTASGATVPLYHGEFRASAAEIGNGNTGFYYQFFGLALQSVQLTEQSNGDTLALQYMALGMVGPTGSGYLS